MKTEIKQYEHNILFFCKTIFFTICNVVKDHSQYSEITCIAYTFIIVLSV